MANRSSKFPHLLVGGVLSLALVASACGGSNKSSTNANVTSSPASQSAVSSSPVGTGVATTTTKEISPSGDIPDNAAYIPYAGLGFTIKVPEGWARSQSGAAVVFTDKLNVITVEKSQMATAPTTDSVTKLDFPTLSKSLKNFTAGKVTMVSKPAGSVVLAKYTADGLPSTVTGKVLSLAAERYEFWKNGVIVVLTLAGPVGADNVDPWKIVSESFQWSN